jgi:hypothetical protein
MGDQMIGAAFHRVGEVADVVDVEVGFLGDGEVAAAVEFSPVGNHPVQPPA